jgi:hypothetical protein
LRRRPARFGPRRRRRRAFRRENRWNTTSVLMGITRGGWVAILRERLSDIAWCMYGHRVVVLTLAARANSAVDEKGRVSGEVSGGAQVLGPVAVPSHRHQRLTLPSVFWPGHISRQRGVPALGTTHVSPAHLVTEILIQSVMSETQTG